MSAAATVDPAATHRRLSDLEIVFVDLDAARELLESEETSTPRLSSSDHLRVDRLSSDPARQSLWRSARIATRIVLERAAGPSVRGAEFQIASGGRPSLAEGLPHFNVSHSGNAAIIAVCRSSPVGVDIECRRSLSMSPERRRRIVAAAEGLAGESKIDPSSDLGVLSAWVRLEAVAKARGSGIGVLLTETGVIGSAADTSDTRASLFAAVADIVLESPYVAAVAAAALPAEIAVTRFPTEAAALDAFLRNA